MSTISDRFDPHSALLLAQLDELLTARGRVARSTELCPELDRQLARVLDLESRQEPSRAAWRLLELAVLDAEARPNLDENPLLAGRYLLALGDLPKSRSERVHVAKDNGPRQVGEVLKRGGAGDAAPNLIETLTHRFALAATAYSAWGSRTSWYGNAPLRALTIEGVARRMAELVEDENVIAELRRIDLTQSPASKLGDGLRRRRGGGPGPGTAGYGAGAGIEPFGDESRTDLTRAEPSLGKVDRPAETTAVANRNQGKSPPESTRDIEQAAEAAKPHRVEKGADDSDRAAIRAQLARDRAEERVRRRKKRWRILVRDSPFYLLVGVVVVVAGWLELRSPTGGGTEPTSSPLPIKIDSVQTDARPKDVPPGWNERGPGVGESVRFIVKLKNPGRKSLEMAYLAANIYRDKDYEPGSMGHSPFYVVFTLADAQGWLERPEKGSTEPLAEFHSTFVSVLYDDRCAESAKPRIEKMTELKLDDGKTNARAISADSLPNSMVGEDALSTAGMIMRGWDDEVRTFAVDVDLRPGEVAEVSDLQRGSDVLSVAQGRGVPGPTAVAGRGDEVVVTLRLEDRSCSAESTGMSPVVRVGQAPDKTTRSVRLTAMAIDSKAPSASPLELGAAAVNYSDSNPYRLAVVPGSTDLLAPDQRSCEKLTRLRTLPDGILQAGISVGPVFGYVPRDQCDGTGSQRWVRFRVRVVP